MTVEYNCSPAQLAVDLKSMANLLSWCEWGSGVSRTSLVDWVAQREFEC